MSDQDRAPRTATDEQKLEEKSLLGSAYSYIDVAKLSAQSADELADNGDD